MTSASGSNVGSYPISGTARWPALIEALLALVAIAALIPSFERLATDDFGRDRRFADAALAVGGLPEKVLPVLCAGYGALAEPRVRDRLCRGSDRSRAAHADAIPERV